jgi:hypothetical protein
MRCADAAEFRAHFHERSDDGGESEQHHDDDRLVIWISDYIAATQR